MSDLQSAQELLYRALRAPIGIAVSMNDVTRGKALLYRARDAAKDPELARLTFRTNPLAAATEVFILRGVSKLHEGSNA